MADEAACLALAEGLSTERRADLLVPVGFLPQPFDVASWAALWLNESAQHSWDVRVAGDSETVVRLFGGRLTPPSIPADLTVTGNVGLDDLRRVFPGY